jgi:hypothetical protein
MVAACPLPYPRGTPIRIHGLANAPAERGHEVHVAAYHLGEAEGEIRYQLHRIPRVATYRKVSPGPSWQKLLVLDPLLTLTLRRVLRRFEPRSSTLTTSKACWSRSWPIAGFGSPLFSTSIRSSQQSFPTMRLE